MNSAQGVNRLQIMGIASRGEFGRNYLRCDNVSKACVEDARSHARNNRAAWPLPLFPTPRRSSFGNLSGRGRPRSMGRSMMWAFD